MRPTRTDGDAVSIREAMHFGRPVVASDAVPRPEGVVTFPSRDQAAFEAAVLETLSKTTPRNASANDAAQHAYYSKPCGGRQRRK